MTIKNSNDRVVSDVPVKGKFLFLAGFAFACSLFTVALPALVSQTFTRVVVPVSQTVPERAATSMLIEEAARRSPGASAPVVAPGALASLGPNQQAVVLANRDKVASLLPPELLSLWAARTRSLHTTTHPEGFSIVSLPWHASAVTVIAGNDDRGELFGAGYLLRQMACNSSLSRVAACIPEIPAHLAVFTAPDKPIRGHQIGYRNKNNTYDAWTLPQFEEQIRDLAIFGSNAIQIIAPVSDDDATSVLYPAPPLQTVIGISGLLKKYGLDCDLYYPEMRDYTKPNAVEDELKDFEELVRAMPAVDSLHIPGGDPGHTPPELLFPLVAREAEVLHRYHPNASVWVSAQGFDRQRYSSFYALLNQHPQWLTGIFFGPQSRDSFETQRRLIPALYPLQFYPDIAHTMHAQFPVPQWDPIWALTEGREPICPRPAAFDAIYQHFKSLHSGFFTYSEGVNDDVNKIVFTQLGWSSVTPVDTILSEYARYFLHRQGGQIAQTVQAIHGLEEDWNGPIETNRSIAKTHALLDRLNRDSTPAQIGGNGRWESLVYRVTYDDYVQRKLVRERGAEQAALHILRNSAAPPDFESRVAAARSALADTATSLQERQEHDRLFILASQLFHDWGLQLSVPLYHAENWERGANLDRVDTPLNDAAWLNHAMDEALEQPSEAARLASLHRIAFWEAPVSGAFYDDLGNPANEPHLVRGFGWQQDPELYHTVIDGIADRTLAANPSPAITTVSSKSAPWRLSWLDYAETLYETPLTLRYTGLKPHQRYTVRVTYAGEDYALPLKLVANGHTEIHAARLRHANPETVDFPTPVTPDADGSLILQWTGPSGSGGSGRGRQVAEVWLLPQPADQ